ncbi:DoxX family protein [Bradyrhizobium sp. 2TAF24]|uniref:DoxX family protein n=1 Tax=Bradyrhizobium sp. 2TAF24 TaxID=3233011 RepID=UPI003F914CBE
MSGIVAIGRILFAVLFVFSGANKLFDISVTAQEIATKVVIPAALTSYTGQLESLTGMPIAQQLAIAAGALEVICGLMIALNFGARFFAAILILFVIAVTVFYHDFWNMTGADRVNNTIHALKNLSLVGALLIIVGFPRRSAEGGIAYGEH